MKIHDIDLDKLSDEERDKYEKEIELNQRHGIALANNQILAYFIATHISFDTYISVHHCIAAFSDILMQLHMFAFTGDKSRYYDVIQELKSFQDKLNVVTDGLEDILKRNFKTEKEKMN